MLDKVRARLEKAIITFFIPALEQATKYYNYILENERKFAKQQEEAAQRGNKIITDPRTGIRQEVPMNAREQANRAREQEEQRMAGLMSAYRPRPNERPTGAMGGFGATPKEDLEKARKEAEALQKELDKQLKTVDGIGNSYELASQAAQDRLNLQMATVKMTEQERTMYEGVYDINRKANEAIVRLEEQRQGAKGQTLALINSEIAGI
jgi:hypothetical protein